MVRRSLDAPHVGIIQRVAPLRRRHLGAGAQRRFLSWVNIVHAYTAAGPRSAATTGVIAHAAARCIVPASSVYTAVHAARTSGMKASPKPFSRVQSSAAP